MWWVRLCLIWLPCLVCTGIFQVCVMPHFSVPLILIECVLDKCWLNGMFACHWQLDVWKSFPNLNFDWCSIPVLVKELLYTKGYSQNALLRLFWLESKLSSLIVDDNNIRDMQQHAVLTHSNDPDRLVRSAVLISDVNLSMTIIHKRNQRLTINNHRTHVKRILNHQMFKWHAQLRHPQTRTFLQATWDTERAQNCPMRWELVQNCTVRAELSCASVIVRELWWC